MMMMMMMMSHARCSPQKQTGRAGLSTAVSTLCPRTFLLFLLLISHARQQRGKASGDILVTNVQDGSSTLHDCSSSNRQYGSASNQLLIWNSTP
jgi:hypothetical protein